MEDDRFGVAKMRGHGIHGDVRPLTKATLRKRYSAPPSFTRCRNSLPGLK